MFTPALLAGLALLAPVRAAYGPVVTYDASNFFDSVDFFYGQGDPTHGFVNYVDPGTAWNTGLIKNNSGVAYMGVDTTNKYSSGGRPSVRVSSKENWQYGLFVLDLAHMPGSACGTWPAYWFLGATAGWPYGGEIDVIEGVNSQKTNDITLHTGPGCTISSTGTGTVSNSDCNAFDNGNQGCSAQDPTFGSYGTDFNSIGGGFIAMEWTSGAIRSWFFPPWHRAVRYQL
jgi:hypothetical protein